MPLAPPIVMAVAAGDIAQLRALGAPRYQEVIRVHWGATIKNYANTSINELSNFPGSTAVFGIILPRIEKDKWIEFKMSSLLDDDSITLELSDPDEAIKALARDSGEGQKVEVYSYYPDVTYTNPNGLAVLRWWGLMKRPKNVERYTFKAEVAAGFRSPNMTLPKRYEYVGCQATYGAQRHADGTLVFPTVAAVALNACPHNLEQGGSVGNPGFPTCPRTPSVAVLDMDGHPTGEYTGACPDRLGDPLWKQYYLGFPHQAAFSSFKGKSTTYIARSEFNKTIVKKRLPVPYGTCRITEIEPMVTQSQISPDPEREKRGHLLTLYNICEGTLDDADTSNGRYGYQGGLFYFTVNGIPVDTGNVVKSNGKKAEPYVDDGAVRKLGYQYTAQVRADLEYGTFNARGPADAKASVTVRGKSDIRVYTDTGPTDYTETRTTNRAWCIFDMLTNKRYGLGYDYDLFYLQDWLNLAAWCDQTLPMLEEDGVTTSSYIRSTINVLVTERPAAQVMNDLCASGRISLPFFFQGRIRVVGLGLETLTGLLTFSEESTHGFSPNIRKGSLNWTTKSDEEIVNQVKMTYDEFLYSPNGDNTPWDVYERSIVLDDQFAQLRAGQTLGDQSTRIIDGSFQAFGVSTFPEVGRLTTAVLDLGEHEHGGIENPLEATFETTAHNADAFQLHQNRLIKILDAGLNLEFESDGTFYDTFRVKELRRKSDGWLTVTCQAYPKSYMAKLENGTYVKPLAWAVTESNYGRVIRRDPRIQSPRTMPDGRTVVQPRVGQTGRTIDAGRGIVLPPEGVEQIETATVVGTVLIGGNATIVVTAAGMANSPKTLSIRLTGGVTQQEAGIVVGDIDTSGNAGCRVTATGMTGSPKLFTVPVTAGYSPIQTAQAITAALAADADVIALFDVRRSWHQPLLTRLTPAANDAALNIEIGNGSVFGLGSSCAGLTTEAVSIDTRAGVASGDNASVVATRIAAAMNADPDIFAWFEVVADGANIVLTRRAAAANDATVNVSIANGTCTGLTAAPTSANTRAGVAP